MGTSFKSNHFLHILVRQPQCIRNGHKHILLLFQMKRRWWTLGQRCQACSFHFWRKRQVTRSSVMKTWALQCQNLAWNQTFPNLLSEKMFLPFWRASKENLKVSSFNYIVMSLFFVQQICIFFLSVWKSLPWTHICLVFIWGNFRGPHWGRCPPGFEFPLYPTQDWLTR